MRYSNQDVQLEAKQAVWIHHLISSKTMAGSSFCLLVLVLTIVGYVSALKTLPKSEPEFRAAMMRRLHKNGPPDLLAMKAAYDANPRSFATTYTSAGYIANGIYTDTACSVMEFTVGTPVNTCFVEEEGYAYMYRLIQGITSPTFLKDLCVIFFVYLYIV